MKRNFQIWPKTKLSSVQSTVPPPTRFLFRFLCTLLQLIFFFFKSPTKFLGFFWNFWLWFLVINISNYFSRNFSEQQLLVLLLLPLTATTIINLSIPFIIMPMIFEISKEFLLSRKQSDMTLNLTSVSFMSLAIRLFFCSSSYLTSKLHERELLKVMLMFKADPAIMSQIFDRDPIEDQHLRQIRK